jgi:phosphopantothenoylcysteine synthetase/decarboxylase
MSLSGRVLYVIACASPAVQLVPSFVRRVQAGDWHVCVIATPEARKFLDIPFFKRLTGYPVRSQFKQPEEPDILPRADAVVAFPATFNTLNKWALGITDTLAVGLLCEYTGLRMPMVAVPCVAANSGLDGHPAFQRSLAQLREYGVQVVYDPDTYSAENEALPELVAECLERTTRLG